MDNKNHIYSNHQPKHKELRRKCNASAYKSIWKLFFWRNSSKLMFNLDYAYAIEH